MEEKNFWKTLWKMVKLLEMGNFTFPTMFSMQSVSENPLIARFQLLFAGSLNLGWSQNGVLGNGLNPSLIHAAQSVAYRTFEQEVAGSIPQLGQYSFRGLRIVIATGFIPVLPLPIVSTIVIWESSQWLGKNIVRSTG